MWTLLLAVVASLFVVNQLEPWGLATFGLWGWWLLMLPIGAVTGLVVVAGTSLVARIRTPR